MESTKTLRPYRMTARADAATATGERILDATEELFWAQPLDRLSLGDVASRAGVTVQTVIRRYGSKDELIQTTIARAVDQVRKQRDEAPVGDLAGAMANLLDHYEQMGERALRLLAEEGNGDAMRAITENGRKLHRRWVERTFEPQLALYSGADRKRRLAQLVAVTDVYMWKLLRLDAGLSRPQVERALIELIDGLGEN